MTRCGETILRTGFAVQQHRQSTSAVCVFTCVFVCVFLGLCGGRRVSCHSIHAASANNWVTDRKRGPPISPFLSIMHVVQRYLSRKKLWMPEWCHILSPGFMAFRVHLFRRLKSLSPWQSDFPPDFGFGSSCHTLESATLLSTLRKEALMWLFVCSL